MRLLSTILAGVIFLSFAPFTAINLNNNTLDDNPLIGAWQLVERNGEKFESSTGIQEVRIFSGDYTMFTRFDIEKKLDKAEAIFRRIIQLESKQTRAYMGLSRILARKGQLAASEKYLIEATRIDPQNVKPSLVLFNFYSSKQDFQKAEAILNQAVRLNPDNIDLLIQKGTPLI